MTELQHKAGKRTICPGKDVVAPMADGFRQELRQIVTEGIREVVIDLEGVEMVDSVGIGVIVATHNSLRRVGGSLEVANVSEDIHKLFKMMRLDEHFDVLPREAQC